MKEDLCACVCFSRKSICVVLNGFERRKKRKTRKRERDNKKTKQDLFVCFITKRNYV